VTVDSAREYTPLLDPVSVQHRFNTLVPLLVHSYENFVISCKTHASTHIHTPNIYTPKSLRFYWLGGVGTKRSSNITTAMTLMPPKTAMTHTHTLLWSNVRNASEHESRPRYGFGRDRGGAGKRIRTRYPLCTLLSALLYTRPFMLSCPPLLLSFRLYR
jgi:hypothetical protein